jgi:transcription termination factor Rho
MAKRKQIYNNRTSTGPISAPFEHQLSAADAMANSILSKFGDPSGGGGGNAGMNRRNDNFPRNDQYRGGGGGGFQDNQMDYRDRQAGPGNFGRGGGHSNRNSNFNRDVGSNYNRDGNFNRDDGNNRGGNFNRDDGNNRGGAFNKDDGNNRSMNFNRDDGNNRGGNFNRDDGNNRGGSNFSRGRDDFNRGRGRDDFNKGRGNFNRDAGTQNRGGRGGGGRNFNDRRGGGQFGGRNDKFGSSDGWERGKATLQKPSPAQLEKDLQRKDVYPFNKWILSANVDRPELVGKRAKKRNAKILNFLDMKGKIDRGEIPLEE